MPEVVFAAIGAVATGMFGISPDSSRHTLETLARLPAQVEWTRLSRVPVLQNEVAVDHRGASETIVTNQSGPPLQWRASFTAAPGDRTPRILVDGVRMAAAVERRINRQTVVSVVIPVSPGQDTNG